MNEKLDGAMRIFQALSSVDEELLVRSEGEKKVIPILRYAKVMAACLCFVVLGVATYAGMHLMSSGGTKTADSAAPMEEADMIRNEAAADGSPAAMIPEKEADIEMESAQEEARAEDNLGAPAVTEDKLIAEQEKDMVDDSIHDLLESVSGTVSHSESKKAAEKELRETENLGKYIPQILPEGYLFADGYYSETEAGTECISLTWYDGMDYITISVMESEDVVDLSKRLVDVSEPETYDVHLYEIPYADSVPEELRTIFHNPVFKEQDFSRELVEARMRRVSEEGDADTPRGDFSVLYDSGVIVSFNGRGNTEAVWDMFQSIENR